MSHAQIRERLPAEYGPRTVRGRQLDRSFPGAVQAGEMSMRGARVVLALLLLLGLSVLTPLAYATPPDPSWVHGIYDDADSDDVVVQITSAAAVATPVLVADIWLLPPCPGLTAQPVEGPAPTRPFSSLQSRAPPAS